MSLLKDCEQACLEAVGADRFAALKASAELWVKDIQANNREPIRCLDIPELAIAIRAARVHGDSEYDAAREYLGAVAELVFPPLPVLSYRSAKGKKYEKPKRPGFVYVLTNPSLDGMVKVGMTTATVERRAKQLSQSTSIPTQFEIHASFESTDPSADEQRVHLALQEHRVPSSEFFMVSAAKAAEMCAQVIGGAQ